MPLWLAIGAFSLLYAMWVVFPIIWPGPDIVVKGDEDEL